MEIFYRDDQGSLFEDLTGNNRSGIDNAYIESCIRSNVSNFFKEKPEDGDLYLKDFFNEKRSLVEFPRELYKFILFNYDNESDKLRIPHYDLDDIFWDHQSNEYGVKAPEDERDRRLREIIGFDSWIVEGVFRSW
ncbi:hypothetical protein ABGV42_31025 [Paenibacillus pabuli]